MATTPLRPVCVAGHIQENASLTRMALPEATFLGETGGHKGAKSSPASRLSSRASGISGLVGQFCPNGWYPKPAIPQDFPFRQCHSSATPIFHCQGSNGRTTWCGTMPQEYTVDRYQQDLRPQRKDWLVWPRRH